MRYRTMSSVGLLAAATGYLLVSLYDSARLGASDGAARAPVVMFRALAPREAYGRIATLEMQPDSRPHFSPLTCTRLHFAGNRGLCAVQELANGAMVNVMYPFSRTFDRGPRVVLDGVPTRLRVAPDGRRAAVTTYRHEPDGDATRLVTRTRILDMQRGRFMTDLHEFRIDNFHLPPIRGPIDFTTVVFERDGDRLFATLATEETRYLVAGSIRERRLTTIRTDVVAESLSPDGRRLLVRRVQPQREPTSLAVIELATWSERELSHGPRGVAGQVEWLDNSHVIYQRVDGESTAVWTLDVDGAAPPRVLVRDAALAAVQR